MTDVNAVLAKALMKSVARFVGRTRRHSLAV